MPTARWVISFSARTSRVPQHAELITNDILSQLSAIHRLDQNGLQHLCTSVTTKNIACQGPCSLAPTPEECIILYKLYQPIRRAPQIVAWQQYTGKIGRASCRERVCQYV